ncbi:MAG TPA: lipopolysaccharide biosynthesis protein [Steroidobacteraceae bacterium]|nr:lipopolysaccharide biosynthesis protein [Steroidobacteraceae bacterium]
MSALKARLLAGLGANAFGQLITIGIQLASVPLFLHYWSLQDYGLWLLIYAIPACISFADVGVGPVAMNRMTMLAAQDRHTEANVVFQTALALTMVSTAMILVLGLAVIWNFDLGPVRDLPTRTTLSLLVAGTLLNIYAPLFDGQFRSAGRFATGTVAIHAGRLFEWSVGMLGLAIFRSMLAVAGGMLIARMVASIVMVIWTRRQFPQYRWGVAAASRAELRTLLPPAAAFLALPAGNALLLQGVSIVVGGTFGTGALAVFNTLRTLTRTPVQLLTMFSRSLWPEMSRSYGAGDTATLGRLYRHSARSALVACAIACVCLYFAAPLILKVWTHGQVEPDPLLLALLLITALASCAWQIAQVLLSSTNTHMRMSAWYLSAALLVVALVTLLPESWGMSPLAGALILFEVVMFAVSRRLVAVPLQMTTTLSRRK